MNIHSVSLKGLRKSNEDKHSIFINLDGKDSTKGNINLFCIFDGHGGKEVSSFLQKSIPNIFLNPKLKYPLSNSMVTEIFHSIQKQIETNIPKSSDCGSTCQIIIHFKQNHQSYLQILNLGDTRSILCRDKIAIPLTNDHKPDFPDEVRRIKTLGGKIYLDGDDWRVGDLSVSRSFGDNNHKPYISHLPDSYVYKINDKDKFFVLACDGLWDVCRNQDVVNFILNSCYDETFKIQIPEKQNIAKQLANFALEKGSTDNLTVLVIFF